MNISSDEIRILAFGLLAVAGLCGLACLFVFHRESKKIRDALFEELRTFLLQVDEFREQQHCLNENYNGYELVFQHSKNSEIARLQEIRYGIETVEELLQYFVKIGKFATALDLLDFLAGRLATIPRAIPDEVVRAVVPLRFWKSLSEEYISSIAEEILQAKGKYEAIGLQRTPNKANSTVMAMDYLLTTTKYKKDHPST